MADSFGRKVLVISDPRGPERAVRIGRDRVITALHDNYPQIPPKSYYSNTAKRFPKFSAVCLSQSKYQSFFPTITVTQTVSCKRGGLSEYTIILRSSRFISGIPDTLCSIIDSGGIRNENGGGKMRSSCDKSLLPKENWLGRQRMATKRALATIGNC
jgi:hypothetical protein